MELLETKRQAADRRRVVLMSHGIASFLEKASLIIDSKAQSESITTEKKTRSRKIVDGEDIYSRSRSLSDTDDRGPTAEVSKPSVTDKISMTLDQAASILRQSLELNSGGVVFLDTTVGYTAGSDTDAYLDETTILGAQFVQTKREQSRRKSNTQSSILSQPVFDIGDKLSPQSVKFSTDTHKATKVQAMSTAEIGMSFHRAMSI